MPDVFGRSGSDLRERVGTLSQVVRIDSFVEDDGPSRGARRMRVVNGGGIELELYPDRALDIGQVTVDGFPVAWISPSGITRPDGYEPDGNGWLRTFGGGLLATCGLDTFGPPSQDDGQTLGQHGRIGVQRAQIVRAEATAEGVVVEALVRQAATFGENLVLRRRVSSAAGSDTVEVSDTVTNESFRDQAHMVLYHLNLGWPLLDDGSAVSVASAGVRYRDADAESGRGSERVVGPPVPGFREQVFIHEIDADSAVDVVVANPDNGLEFVLSAEPATFAAVHQWKMVGQGHYVLGIEPANTPHIHGRASARAAGELPMLAPGESVTYTIRFRLRRNQPPRSAAHTEEAA